MELMIAYCGLNCAECEAYKASQADDLDWKARVAAQWQTEFNLPPIDPNSITCDGCRTPNGRLSIYCGECPVRACGVQAGVETCAHCADYETCIELNEFLKNAPQAKTNLEEIRRLL